MRIFSWRFVKKSTVSTSMHGPGPVGRIMQPYGWLKATSKYVILLWRWRPLQAAALPRGPDSRPPLDIWPGAQLGQAQGASYGHRPSTDANIPVSLLIMTRTWRDPLGASKDWREGERLAKQANNMLFVAYTSESLTGSLCRASSNTAFFSGFKRTVRWVGLKEINARPTVRKRVVQERTVTVEGSG